MRPLCGIANARASLPADQPTGKGYDSTLARVVNKHLSVTAAWPEERAHIYASAYADAKLAGRDDADARAYATAYEEAYTSQVEAGATEDEARLYAAAFADAKLGS